MIYFIRGGGCVKIGFSRSEAGARSRLRSCQTGNPERLVLLAMVPGSLEDERLLHRHFEMHRLSGEWFELTDHLAEATSSVEGTVGLLEQVRAIAACPVCAGG